MARQQSYSYANKDCMLRFWVLVGCRLLLRDGLMTRLTPLLRWDRIGTSCCSFDGALGQHCLPRGVARLGKSLQDLIRLIWQYLYLVSPHQLFKQDTGLNISIPQ